MASDCNDRRVSIGPLLPQQLKTATEWEYGPQPEETDWHAHAKVMADPKWTAFAVYLDGDFVARLLIESIDAKRVRFHLSKAPHSLTPVESSRLLINIGMRLFDNDGIEEIEALSPLGHRASRLLARRSWMRHREDTPAGHRFSITKTEYLERIYGRTQTAGN